MKKPKEDSKTRCSSTMTEAQYLAWVRSALRSKWLRWPPRAIALKLAQVAYVGPNVRQKYSYKCAICGELFNQKDVEVDHYPIDAGSILSTADIGEFVNNLYCETSNLRVVCKKDHAIYTFSQKMGITFEEARIEKEIIAITKLPVKEVIAFCKAKGYTDELLSNAAKRKKAVVEILKKEK